jgi:uncharacterized SAM-binding protein YcdF (DUF218 family)
VKSALASIARLRLRALRPVFAVLFCGLAAAAVGEANRGALLRPLEERFAPATLDAAQSVDGVIALGGDFKRFEVAVGLAKRFPKSRLILCARGDDGSVGALLRNEGIPEARATFEVESTTTYENALFAARLLAPQPGQRWLLVTSAWHMPRAVGAFRKVGFAVMPWPIRYPGDDAERRPLATGLHEWVGLFSYWLFGRGDALFPSPAVEG